jgi:hypothetical protein
VRHAWIVLAAALAASAGCSSTTDVTPITSQGTACPSGAAEIAVTDGYVQALCGCAESSATPVTPPAALKCTVPVNTVVVFDYLNGTKLRHQIVPTGAPAFAASPVSDPGSSSAVRFHAVQLAAPGSYGFQDSYDEALNGALVAQ